VGSPSPGKSTTPARRPPVRPIPIREFGDRVLNAYKAKNPNVYNRAHRVVEFLIRHSSVKTTADLTTKLIPDFEATFGHLSAKSQLQFFHYFRRICNLAVEWDGLKRSPFDGYRFPKRRRPTGQGHGPEGEKLDNTRVKSLLVTAKDGAVTYKLRRIYTLICLLTYTNLLPHEAFKLTIVDGKVRFPKRLEATQVPPILAAELDAWLLVGRQAKQDPKRSYFIGYGEKLADDGITRIPDDVEQAVIADILRLRSEGETLARIAAELNARGIPTKKGNCKWTNETVSKIIKRIADAKQKRSDADDTRGHVKSGKLGYGEKFDDDGRNRIPHAAEQAVIADILRWRSEFGWGGKRIAAELNRRGVPTKTGNAEWGGCVVDAILRRIKRPDPGQAVATSEGETSDAKAEEGSVQEVEPDWLFPSLSGKGHWIGRKSALVQLRRFGKALGIEGLNLKSLSRYQHEASQETPGSTRLLRKCPIELRGEGLPIRVYGEQVPPMTGIAYELAEFAVERFHQGGVCFGNELAIRTKTDRPIRLLMMKLDQTRFEPLARVLIWDARKGGTLRVIDPGPPG
jgi:hypothetical protein